MVAIGDKFGKASKSNQYAPATTVKTARIAGVTVLETFDLSKYPTDTPLFFVTYQKSIDPVTSVVTIINQVSWKALVNDVSNTLTNLTVAPGYTDLGNLVGDFVEAIPTSYWETSLIDALLVSLNPDGTLIPAAVRLAAGGDATDPVMRDNERGLNFVTAGSGIIAGLGYGSTLTASMTGGFCYINGYRQIIAPVATRTYTASKDTYVDLLYNASGTATVVYTEVANNAASPALAANSIRLGIVVTGANIAAVASINQGQNEKLLPIAGGFPYVINDSLGNRICRRNPSETRRGFKLINANGAIMSNTWVTYISLPMITFGRSLEIDVAALINDGNSGASRTGHIRAQIDGVTVTDSDAVWQTVSTGQRATVAYTVTATPAAGFHTVTLQLIADTGSASALNQASMKVTES
jgi:hypothetical protein